MKYIFILIVTLLSFGVKGQNITPAGNTTQVMYNKGSYKTDRLQILPRTFIPFPSFDSTAAIWFDSAGTKSIWYHNGTARVQLGSGGGDSSLFFTNYRADTMRANIYGAINAIPTDFLPLTGGTMSGAVDFNNNILTGIPTPTMAGDAVPLDYLQQFLNGLSWKASVLAATATTLPAFTYGGSNNLVFPNGTCPVIDGITLHLGNSLLNKNSTGADTAFNGIYTVTQLGNVSTQCIFTRRADANTALLLKNATVSADSGITNMGKGYTQTNTINTINVDPVTFVPILDAVAVAGRGLGKAGNVAYVDSVVVRYKHDSDDIISPYDLTQGFTISPTRQIDFIDASSNQLAILNSSTITVQNAAGTTGIDHSANMLTFNKPNGGTNIQNRYPTGTKNWYFPNTNGVVMDSTAAYDSFSVLRTAIGGVSTIDTTSLSNRINARVKYTDSGSVYYSKYGDDTAKLTIRSYTVTTQSGYGITGGGSAQAISANPSRTLVLDSATAYTAVMATIAANNGIIKSGRTLSADSGILSTKAYRQKGIDSVMSVTSPSQAWTVGSIPYAGSTGNNTLTQDNSNLFYNSTTKSVGIGTVSPTANLDVRGTASATMINFAQSWTGSGSPVSVVIAVSDASSGTGKLQSWRGGASGTTERMSIDRNGNLVVQNSTTTPNLWSATVSAGLMIRNQAGNATTNNTDGVSVFRDRGGTNALAFTATAGQTNAWAFYPTYNQGTGATTTNTDILLNRTETSIGTGTTQRLLDLQVGSTTKHNITNTGVNFSAGAVLAGGATNDGTNSLIVTGSAAISSVPTGARTDTRVTYNPSTGQLRQLQPYDSIVATGNTTYSVVPNGQLFSITFKPVANETIKVGTTSGGTEVMVGTAFGAGTTTTVTVNKEFGPVATTLFIQGAVGSVNYHIRVQ